ncbi:hypothetical protein GOP47_0025298 [Adiantum capillus-veneris]|uniref:Uncharacterized protein n=1 Tax=Adiantum capillus-veneris TaxID=13818 RepID=A0A9D4U1X8_ADICA|nr:hypothetical protein GOP47_0025298 [Adiantum capillus-veneris]
MVLKLKPEQLGLGPNLAGPASASLAVMRYGGDGHARDRGRGQPRRQFSAYHPYANILRSTPLHSKRAEGNSCGASDADDELMKNNFAVPTCSVTSPGVPLFQDAASSTSAAAPYWASSSIPPSSCISIPLPANLYPQGPPEMTLRAI